MIELVFVIVVMGIIGKYGAEIFRNVYQGYINSSIQNRLQEETELALQQIANRLPYRIKNSAIAKKPDGTFLALSSPAIDGSYTIMEWVGYDIDGWLAGTWSGFIDVDNNASSTTVLVSPGTTTTDSGAIFFIGANANVQEDFGWDGTATTQANAAHPVNMGANIAPDGGDFSGVDIYEFYQFATTAYAIQWDQANGNLILWEGYKPWDGDTYNGDGTSHTLLGGTNINVTAFQFVQLGDMIKVRLCAASKTNTDNDSGGGYSVCKEKAIF